MVDLSLRPQLDRYFFHSWCPLVPGTKVDEEWKPNGASGPERGYQIVSIPEWTKNVHFRWTRMDISAASSEGCTVQRGLHNPF